MNADKLKCITITKNDLYDIYIIKKKDAFGNLSIIFDVKLRINNDIKLTQDIYKTRIVL